MAVSSSFHKNVYLLSQMVSPNDGFRQHFQQGMFEKPNTAGFIQVSHFLLTIYDADRFKKLVEWPIICKKSESKYKKDVKNFIGIVANEHPEAGFPPILGTYLLHTGGHKFTTVMWKLSQVVLYVQVKRESQNTVLSIPQPGIAEKATKLLLKKEISQMRRSIIELDNEFSETERKARSFVEEMANEIKSIEKETFETRQSIFELASKANVSSVVKKRLMDIEDNEIIKMWKDNLTEQTEKLKERTSILKTIEDLSTEVAELATSLSNDSSTLDVSRLPKVDTNSDLHSMVPPELQVHFFRIYDGDELVLENLFKIVYTMLSQLKQKLQIHRLQNLSQCQLQIEASNEDAVSMCSLYLVLLDKITNLSMKVGNNFRNKHLKYASESVGLMFQVMNDVLLMPSPTICINTNPDSDKSDIQNRLTLTPVEGAHKALFSRHKRNEETTPQSSKLRTNLLVSRINLDDTWSSVTSERLTPQSRKVGTLSKMNTSMPKKSEKYSRLFFAHHKLHSNRANSSLLSMPSSPKANSTALMNTISETNNAAELSLDFMATSLFNLSTEIMSAVSVMTKPNSRSPLKQHKPSEMREELALKEDKEEEKEVNVEVDEDLEVFSSPREALKKVIKPSLDDDKEIEMTAKCASITESPQQRRRRSISDLVERYKLILEKSRITSHLETSEISNESG